MERRLMLALFLLNFNSQPGRGQLLSLEAVEGHISVLTPALKELYDRDGPWRRQVIFFEIEPPNHPS